MSKRIHCKDIGDMISAFNDYALHKKYDIHLGDTVPLLCANALGINIIVLNDSCKDRLLKIIFRKKNSKVCVFVYKRGHYDGLIPMEHINLCKKVASKLSVLNRLCHILSREMLSMQYLLCIQPCIDYAISVWGTCSKQFKDKITRLQDRAARIATGIFDFINFRGANLMENLGWHSFDNRKDYFTATMMFKCINGLAPLRLTNELSVISDAHSANTRASSNGNILVPMPHVEQFRNSFKYLMEHTATWYTLCFLNTLLHPRGNV